MREKFFTRITNSTLLNLDKKFMKNLIINILHAILIYGLSFMLSAFLARTFTKEFYGYLQFIQQIIMILIIFSIPGLKIVVFKSISQNYDGLYSSSIKLRIKGSLISSILIILIGVIFLFFDNSKYNLQITISLIICGIILPIYYSLDLWQFIFKGKEKFIYFLSFNFISSVTTFILIYILVEYFFIYNLIVLIILFYFPPVLLNIFFSKYSQKLLSNKKIPENWKKQGYYLTFIDISVVIYSSLAPIIIALFLSIEKLAVYSITFQIVIIFDVLIKAISEVFVPRIYKSKSKIPLKEIVIIFIISFSIPILLGFFIEFPVLLIFSDKYASAVPYCRFILYIIPFNILSSFLHVYLVKNDMIREINISKFFTSIGTVLIFFILIPIFGIYGAVTGLITFFCIQDTFMFIFLYKKSQVFEKNM